VSSRFPSLAVALVALALVVAQIVIPGAAIFHTWQYTVALAVIGYLLVTYATPALRGQEGAASRMLGAGLAGVLIVVAAGIASGLLGPDTERISRAPGTIVPLPDIGAAAFFSNADPQTIASGDGMVSLRRRNHTDIVISPGSHKFLGGLMLMLEPLPAAYFDASDAGGNHLTITQQTGSTFLSPVLLFKDRQSIAGEMQFVGGFELPGAKRSVKVVYFDAEDVRRQHFPVPAEAAGKPVVLYDLFDSSDKSVGIGMAPSGAEVRVGGVLLKATLGTYPQLLIASVPAPIAVLIGLGLFVTGLAGMVVLQAQSGKEARVPRPRGA